MTSQPCEEIAAVADCPVRFECPRDPSVLRVHAPKMAATLSSNLRRLFDDYCLHQRVRPSTVGLEAIRDPRFYAKLQAGTGSFKVLTYDRVVVWFASVWPAQLDWPNGIPRPVVELRLPPKRKPRKSFAHEVNTAPL
jgi:hypothetical protein